VLHLREEDRGQRVPDGEVGVDAFLRAQVVTEDPGARLGGGERDGGEERVRRRAGLIEVRGLPGAGESEAGLEGLDAGGLLDELVLWGRFRYALTVGRPADENQ